jgi:hypothetical protein
MSLQNKTNSMALVHKWTIPTERPPLVGEVSANFCGWRVSHGQHTGSPWPYSRFSRPEPLLFLPSNSSVLLTRLSGPCSRPLLLRKSGSAGNRTWDLWICSQELWSLDHRGGHRDLIKIYQFYMKHFLICWIFNKIGNIIHGVNSLQWHICVCNVMELTLMLVCFSFCYWRKYMVKYLNMYKFL